jgi:amidase
LTVLLYEFKAGLEAYFRRRGGAICNLDDIVAWNRSHANETMPIFGQEHMEKALECGPLTDPDYLSALESSRRLAGKEGLFQLLDDNNLDAIAGASNGPAWLIDHMNGDYYTGGRMSTAPAISGAPHITLPIGYTRGLPMGLSIVGRPGSDGMLLGIAFGLEQLLGARRPPEFREGTATFT